MNLAAISIGQFMSWALVVAICAAIGLLVIGLAFWLFRQGFPKGEDNSMKGMTTFVTVIIGMGILLVMFYMMMNRLDPQTKFDDALKAASIIITPLGTFIGFVAGQSAGNANAERSADILRDSQQLGGDANKRIADLLQTLESQDGSLRLLGSETMARLETRLDAQDRFVREQSDKLQRAMGLLTEDQLRTFNE